MASALVYFAEQGWIGDPVAMLAGLHGSTSPSRRHPGAHYHFDVTAGLTRADIHWWDEPPVAADVDYLNLYRQQETID